MNNEHGRQERKVWEAWAFQTELRPTPTSTYLPVPTCTHTYLYTAAVSTPLYPTSSAAVREAWKYIIIRRQVGTWIEKTMHRVCRWGTWLEKNSNQAAGGNLTRRKQYTGYSESRLLIQTHGSILSDQVPSTPLCINCSQLELIQSCTSRFSVRGFVKAFGSCVRFTFLISHTWRVVPLSLKVPSWTSGLFTPLASVTSMFIQLFIPHGLICLAV